MGVRENFIFGHLTPAKMDPIEHVLCPYNRFRPDVLEGVILNGQWSYDPIAASCFYFTMKSVQGNNIIPKLHYTHFNAAGTNSVITTYSTNPIRREEPHHATGPRRGQIQNPYSGEGLQEALAKLTIGHQPRDAVQSPQQEGAHSSTQDGAHSLLPPGNPGTGATSTPKTTPRPHAPSYSEEETGQKEEEGGATTKDEEENDSEHESETEDGESYTSMLDLTKTGARRKTTFTDTVRAATQKKPSRRPKPQPEAPTSPEEKLIHILENYLAVRNPVLNPREHRASLSMIDFERLEQEQLWIQQIKPSTLVEATSEADAVMHEIDRQRTARGLWYPTMMAEMPTLNDLVVRTLARNPLAVSKIIYALEDEFRRELEKVEELSRNKNELQIGRAHV